MRRALLAASLLAVLAAAPAAAAPGGEKAVIGGGSFVKAPLLGPGRYRDTILPAERLYYGITLAAGQRLKAALDSLQARAEAAAEGIDRSWRRR